MAEFKKVDVLAFSTLLMVFLGMCVSSAGWTETAIIKGIRTGSEQTHVRVVIETNVRLEPRPKISVNRDTLRISLAGVEKDLSTLKSEAYRDDVVNIDVISAPTETRIESILAFVPIRVRTFYLIDPHRFVIDAYRPSSKTSGDPSADARHSISITEENVTRPNETKEQAISPPGNELKTSEMARNATTTANDLNHERFQERLLVFLIVVTSIILVVIIFLMCVDKQRK